MATEIHVQQWVGNDLAVRRVKPTEEGGVLEKLLVRGHVRGTAGAVMTADTPSIKSAHYKRGMERFYAKMRDFAEGLRRVLPLCACTDYELLTSKGPANTSFQISFLPPLSPDKGWVVFWYAA
eukprot:760340-Hanusia_phi.AAC.1